jgi:pimeloyl-ACP methyl ester carboxylesterase
MLSARLFISPQIVGDRIFFISNLGQGGYLSLYSMNLGGSVPQPLLPPQVALQNPDLADGAVYVVLPKLGKILLMLDRDGDENYQPMFVPIEGGIPQAIFGDELTDYRVHCMRYDLETNLAYFVTESNSAELHLAFKADLNNCTLEKLGESQWGLAPVGFNAAHNRVILLSGYTIADDVLFEWEAASAHPETGLRLVAGIPLEARQPDQQIPLTGFSRVFYTSEDKGLLLPTTLFEDTYGLGYLPLHNDQHSEIEPVKTSGQVHNGVGELKAMEHLSGDRYWLEYNIDSCSWLYEGRFDEEVREMRLERVLVGQGEFAGGTLEAVNYDRTGDCYALSFSTATSPSQIYTLEGPERSVRKHTSERVLGLDPSQLSTGEDASFISYDGLRISARLYLPSTSSGFEAPYPLVYYVHGGPQGQERPDFTWFSMPLIQFLTLNGFAVFVPNVRGSTGYGLEYTKKVDRDWGGQDRLDHVYAMTKVLPQDKRLDTKRAGVIGRSYGGYMTLTLATRHPELWSAAVDMFGPYDLLTFTERIPESWKAYFRLAVGDPVEDRDLLVERSPRSYIQQLGCPLLVIQGRNDPRVTENESRDVVEQLRTIGKEVDYLVFEDEGHDVLKFSNRVRCYNTITDFFKQHL